MRSSNTSADDRLPTPLVAALEYANLGYGIFPCLAKNRAPITIRGAFEHGFKSATFDPALITATWTKYKGAEIGLAPPPGILVVDPDMKKGRSGRADFIRLFGCPPEDMPTPVSTTPLGGWHVYLSFDSSLDLVQRPITPSVDVKIGGKGYVLAPYAGNGRRWILPLLTTPLMPAPQWLIDELMRPPERRSTDLGGQAKPFDGKASARALAALDKACAALAAAPPGTRDQTIGAAVFRVGRLAAAGELEPEAALEAMLQAMASNPGTNESHLDKVERQFSSGLKSPAEPGPVDDRHAVEDDFGDDDDSGHHDGGEQASQPPSSSQASQPSSSSSSRSSSSAQQSAPWEPLDLAFLGADVPPPRLSHDMLPEGWGVIIDDLADAATAPTDYVALSVIVGGAGTIGNIAVIEASPGWRQPAVLWGMPVGPPGAKKTPGMLEAHLALIAINTALHRQWKKACNEIDAIHDDALDAHAKAKSAKKAVGKPPKKPERPPRVRLVIDDITVEKVTLALSKSPRGLIGYYPELASWFGSHERYSGGGGDSVRAFWNKAFDASPHIRDRVGVGGEDTSVFVPAAACSIIGGVQPDKLRQYLLEADDGLMARFIYVWPHRRKTQGVNFRRSRHGEATHLLNQAFQKLYALPLAVDEHGAPRPKVLHFAASAEDLFSEANQDCEDRGDGERGILAEYLAKGGGRIMRLALVFEHMAWALRDDDLVPHEIGRDALARAGAYFLYSEKMLRRTLVNLEPTQSTNDAQDIVRHIGKKGWRRFTNYTLERERGFYWFRGESPEAKRRRDNVLKALTESNVIRRVSISVKRGDGWEVHPDLGGENHG